jgi:hypothetical protein
VKFVSIKEKMTFNNNPYGNFKMLSLKGDFLAYTDEKRMYWYVDRNLAKKLDNTTYQLKFETKGGNAERAEFYKLALENKCVVCGTDDELTKHHVVPSQYRKHLPIEYKGRSSYDVVCICNTCHNAYEIQAEELNKEIWAKYGLTDRVKDNNYAKRCFNALKFYRDRLDEDKKEEMISFLELYYVRPFEETLKLDNLEFITISEEVMNHVEDVEEFIVMWRKHFLEVAKPQHIAQEWIDGVEDVFTI